MGPSISSKDALSIQNLGRRKQMVRLQGLLNSIRWHCLGQEPVLAH